MEKSRFNAINDMFRLSNIISESLKFAESFAGRSSGSDGTDCKNICRNIRYSLKPLPYLLDGIREYVAEHEDKELARKFVGLHDDTKRLHGICSQYADLNKVAFRTGVAYLSMEVIRQYFFPEKELAKVSPESADTSPKPMTRTEATDCIDTIHAAIRKCAKDSDGNRGKEMYVMLAKVDKAKIQAVKEYIVNANDKDLAQLFTEHFAEAVHLSMLPQNDDVKVQSAGIKMFHIAMTMGYVKRNVLYESASKATSSCTEETLSSGFTATDTMQGGVFSTTAQVPVLRLYRFLTSFTVQSGSDKGKPLLDGNAVSDQDFLRAVMRADYSMIYGSCVKGKMRCVAILLSKAYFKDWKGYRIAAARSMGLTPESLAKYNVEKNFIMKLKELLPMIK